MVIIYAFVSYFCKAVLLLLLSALFIVFYLEVFFEDLVDLVDIFHEFGFELGQVAISEIAIIVFHITQIQHDSPMILKHW